MSSDPSPTLRESLTGGLAVTTGFILGLLTRTVLRRFRPPLSHSSSSSLSDEDGQQDIATRTHSTAVRNEQHKLVLCVRSDLKMQKGKIAAQVGHATLGAYKTAQRKDPAALRRWENHAQPKIAVQISSEAQARRLEKEAKLRGLVTYMVYDAGRTQIAAVSLRVGMDIQGGEILVMASFQSCID